VKLNVAVVTAAAAVGTLAVECPVGVSLAVEWAQVVTIAVEQWVRAATIVAAQWAQVATIAVERWAQGAPAGTAQM
jgi:hypothetical protein